MRSIFPLLIFFVALAPLAFAQSGTIPDITVEVTFATEGPLSLCSAPDGSGLPFTQAYQFGGSQVDGTLTMILYVNVGKGYEPVANFPFEDMWLWGEGSGPVPCNGGSCADANTDANGVTTWAQPMEMGGQSHPDLGERMWVVVNGDAIASGVLPDLRLNSTDINGDGLVNLSDLQLFSTDFYGEYDYRSDFVWDGMVNLSDVVPLAQTWGAACP